MLVEIVSKKAHLTVTDEEACFIGEPDKEAEFKHVPQPNQEWCNSVVLIINIILLFVLLVLCLDKASLLKITRDYPEHRGNSILNGTHPSQISEGFFDKVEHTREFTQWKHFVNVSLPWYEHLPDNESLAFFPIWKNYVNSIGLHDPFQPIMLKEFNVQESFNLSPSEFCIFFDKVPFHSNIMTVDQIFQYDCEIGNQPSRSVIRKAEFYWGHKTTLQKDLHVGRSPFACKALAYTEKSIIYENCGTHLYDSLGPLSMSGQKVVQRLLQNILNSFHTEYGLFHCDTFPRNIMVINNKIKLIDWERSAFHNEGAVMRSGKPCEVWDLRNFVKQDNLKQVLYSQNKLSTLAANTGGSGNGMHNFKGYYDFQLGEVHVTGLRDPYLRLDAITKHLNFKGKSIIHLGSNGGVLENILSNKYLLKWSVGFDFDNHKVNMATKLAKATKTYNTDFYSFDFDRHDLTQIPFFFPNDETTVDVTLMFAIDHWITRWKELLLEIQNWSTHLFMEINSDRPNRSHSDVQDFLSKICEDVIDITKITGSKCCEHRTMVYCKLSTKI